MTTDITVALVTGANKGIGFHTARQLAGPGRAVLLGSRDERRGAAAAAELAGAGDVRPVRLDVTDPDTIAALAKQIDAEFGRLDVLVNNAGVLGGLGVPGDLTVDGLRAAYETNVFGVVAVTNAMLPLLRRAPAARIVNVSSGLATVAGLSDPAGKVGLTAYNSSKAAVNALTLAYAHELRDTPIKVNAVSPGFCDTDMNGHTGPLPAAVGARVPVHAATLPPDGPSGVFLTADGPTPW